jgi:hypothetical protein
MDLLELLELAVEELLQSLPVQLKQLVVLVVLVALE